MVPSTYALALGESLGLPWCIAPDADTSQAAHLWADSGAMWLSGDEDGAPRACAAPLATCAKGAWLALAALADNSLDSHFSAHRLLGERAAIAGFTRRGRVSPGGACRLLSAAGGWLALNLPRPEDEALLPAWLQERGAEVGQLDELVAARPVGELIERARMLGLAAAPVAPPGLGRTWYRAQRCGMGRVKLDAAPLVIDLSSLWAGPLCGSLLSECGARVIKVESKQRPDGARSGPTEFFDLLNAGKESVCLDFNSPHDIEHLRRLIARADIVVESARPRALEQLGVNAADLVADNPGLVWLSITGYGRSEPQRNWVAYGDDAGVAAGLSWMMGGAKDNPVFCGDAIADPLAGLHGALLAWAAWRQGGSVILDMALKDVVAYCIGAGASGVTVSDNVVPAKPVARQARAAAVEPGVDTNRVLQELTR